jgi:hypothetical protein
MAKASCHNKPLPVKRRAVESKGTPPLMKSPIIGSGSEVKSTQPFAVTWHTARVGAKVMFVKRGLTYRGIIYSRGEKYVMVELARGMLVKRRYNELFYDKE